MKEDRPQVSFAVGFSQRIKCETEGNRPRIKDKKDEGLHSDEMEE